MLSDGMTPVSPVSLLQALIRCPSVTPDEGGALSLLRGLFDQSGFRTNLLTFREPGTPDVVNLYARIGTKAPCLLFAGHTDVVPPGDTRTWRHDPFAGTLADGTVYGRGACDMKGGLAAAVAAVLGFVAEVGAPDGSVAFLVTGDEEGPAVNGTRKLLAWAEAEGEVFDHCILGEPTNPNALGDMIKIGRRGSLSGSLTVNGKQGHVAYPKLACNPIPPLLEALQALLRLPLDDGTAHFDPSNLEVVSIDVGNPSTNVIPATATASFNIRFNDRWTPEALQLELQARIEAAGLAAPCSLAFQPCNALAFVTEPNSFTALFESAVTAETGHRPVLSTSGGTSDARFIVAHCPVVEFGLVGQTMHAVDEQTSVADLEALTQIYRRVLQTYFEAA